MFQFIFVAQTLARAGCHFSDSHCRRGGTTTYRFRRCRTLLRRICVMDRRRRRMSGCMHGSNAGLHTGACGDGGGVTAFGEQHWNNAHVPVILLHFPIQAHGVHMHAAALTNAHVYAHHHHRHVRGHGRVPHLDNDDHVYRTHWHWHEHAKHPQLCTYIPVWSSFHYSSSWARTCCIVCSDIVKRLSYHSTPIDDNAAMTLSSKSFSLSDDDFYFIAHVNVFMSAFSTSSHHPVKYWQVSITGKNSGEPWSCF